MDLIAEGMTFALLAKAASALGPGNFVFTLGSASLNDMTIYLLCTYVYLARAALTQPRETLSKTPFPPRGETTLPN
jgi:hypothetical protein